MNHYVYSRLQSIQFGNTPPKKWCEGTVILAPKFKISVSESELCTVNSKKSPLFLTFVSFEKKEQKTECYNQQPCPPRRTDPYLPQPPYYYYQKSNLRSPQFGYMINKQFSRKELHTVSLFIASKEGFARVKQGQLNL